MPAKLTIGDFKLRRVVCEVRYPNSYLLFDHTGRIVEKLRRSFANVEVQSAIPTATVLTSDDGLMGVEVGACRLTVENAPTGLEDFSRKCKIFFDVIVDALRVNTLTRIGLRTFFMHPTADKSKSESIIGEIPILGLEMKKRFGISDQPSEVTVRWESKQMGVSFRLRAESNSIAVTLPAEFESGKQMKKDFNGVLMDVDYYTVAQVDLGQWDPIVWIPQAEHVVRRECGQILEG
jgi:hypothetical protein